jgi:hypothetical protein
MTTQSNTRIIFIKKLIILIQASLSRTLEHNSRSALRASAACSEPVGPKFSTHSSARSTNDCASLRDCCIALLHCTSSRTLSMSPSLQNFRVMMGSSSGCWLAAKRTGHVITPALTSLTVGLPMTLLVPVKSRMSSVICKP